MFKALIVALICVESFTSAARVPGEPIKKQVTYSGYNNVPVAYQDLSHYYSAAYPQTPVGVVGQGQVPQTLSSSAGTAGASVKQQIYPQKSAAYPSQYYPFKQYYPQIYPQNSQYPSVPSVFYVPSQGRYPQSAANEVGVSNEGTSVSGGSPSGSNPGSWFSSGSWNQIPSNWQQSSVSQLPQGAGSYPQFPGFPNYPAQLPQFPTQFPSQFPQFPSNFPSGNFPSFPAGSPASGVPTGASPTVVPGSEAVAGGTPTSEGQSVVVVSARRPEKIENVDSNMEGVKNAEVDNKVTADFPPQQYYFLQPQYLYPNGGQLPVVQKDPVQLDSAAKGAISSFLFQPQQQQQAVLAQPSPAQQYSPISQNKLYSPQEFQELLQQVQAANKKTIESNGGGALPQFYFQQGVPQQSVVQQGVNSQQQSQDVPAQQVQGVVPQQYLFQGAQPQVQQPYFQFPAQQQQFYVPQFASLPQQKPLVGEVSPGAALAYQRFLLENQKPSKSSFVGVQNVEGSAPMPGAGPTPVSVPSVSSSLPATDSMSSPEPNSSADSESTAGNSAAGSKN